MHSARIFLLLALAPALACSKKHSEPTTDPSASATPVTSGVSALGSTRFVRQRNNVNVSSERRLAAIRPRLYSCYQKVLAGKPNEGGETSISISVGVDGAVKDVKFSPTDLSNDTLDCMRGVIEPMQFNELPEPKVFALTFSSPKDGGK